MKEKAILCIISSLLIAAFILPACATSATPMMTGSDNHTLSPISPKFAQYLEDHKAGGIDVRGAGTNALGYIPPIVDLSHTTGMQLDTTGDVTLFKADAYATLLASYTKQASTITGSPSSSLPSRYDLRTVGKVTSVKDQGQCGSCWAFSTLASLESTLMPGENWDFSENNMRNTNGFDLASCQGGNSVMAAAYLTRWSGVIPESNDPYTPVSKSATSMTVPNTADVKHIQEILFIPGRSGASDNTNIKRALMDQGAIYSSIRWEDSYYQASTASYYYPGGGPANHAITIVGWDDAYDRSRFASMPPGNGAFIVKNSWGASWGDGGYFYVSYYDSQIGKDNAVFLAESAQNYYHIYQYDPLGWTVSYGDGSETVYFSNIFAAQASEDIAAVSFYTPTVNSQYKISVYENVGNSPVSGSALATGSGTIGTPGYHTIPLLQPVRLSTGEKFSVVIKLTTPGYDYPVALEYPYAGYSSRASAMSGQSFVSNDGVAWTDVTKLYPNSNVCLKVFTSLPGQVAQTTIPTPTPTITPTPTVTTKDTTPPTLSVTSPASYATITPGMVLVISWSATDDKGVAGVDIDYSSDGGKSWKVIGTSQQKSGTLQWTVPSTTATSLTIRVKARDNAGNVATQTKVCFIRSTASSRPPIVFNASGTQSTPTPTASPVPTISTTPTTTPTTVLPTPTITFRKTSLSGFF